MTQMLFQPMLLTSVRDAREFPVDEDWLHEDKFDGWRCMVQKTLPPASAVSAAPRISLLTRTGRDITIDFSNIAMEVGNALLPESGVLDCELVALDGEGSECLRALGNRRVEQSHKVVLKVFDILAYNRSIITTQPLNYRKSALDVCLDTTETPHIQAVQPLGDIVAAAATLRNRRREGFIAKLRDSSYRPGVRTIDWCKYVDPEYTHR